MREVRKREPDGHQVSVVATDYRSPLTAVAVRMFARWTQEKFFKYRREPFAIDRLGEHGVEALPATTTLVNPTRRRLEAEVRRARGTPVRAQAQCRALSLSPAPAPAELEAWQAQKARLHETITTGQARLDELKARRKTTPPHVTLGKLPEGEQFPRLRAERNHFMDTIKLLAYRAETALVGTVREALARRDDTRALLREIMCTTADLRPDAAQKTLTDHLHPLDRALQNAAEHALAAELTALAAELTATETVFPGTDLRLIFTLSGPA